MAISFLEHDLVRKPVSTFRDRALTPAPGCATDADASGGIDFKPLLRDQLAALGAFAELSVIHAPQRGVERCDPRAAATLGFLRHRLNLHGIHAREPPDALLVEGNGTALAGARFAGGQKLHQLGFDAWPEPIRQIVC